jgi:hypothetical protein
MSLCKKNIGLKNNRFGEKSADKKSTKKHWENPNTL